MARYKKLTYLFLTIILSIFLLGMNKLEGIENKKIFNNISIQNVDIGGLKYKEALNKINNKYKIKPIKISYEDKVWILQPSQINLSYNVEDALNKAYLYTNTDDNLENIKRKIGLALNKNYNINLNVTYDESKLSDFIEDIRKDIDVDVTEANFEIKGYGEIVRTQSKVGKEVEVIKLKEKIYNMFVNKEIEDIKLPVKIVNPSITTEDVNSIDTVLGQFSTSFNDSSSRGSNIHVAGESTSNKLIMPNEVFSYNKATGARNWINGYKTAKVIVGGKYVDGEGGGVCQVSTTIYNAALLSGVGIEEVHNHTFQSRYVPRGRDASVSYGYTDLKLKNNFTHPIYIYNIVGNGCITSRIYGCKEDKQKLYIKTEEEHKKDNIIVKTYRIYLDEESNKIIEELISTSKYKIK